MAVNKVMLLGRMVRDCDTKYSTSGVAVSRFTLAVDRPWQKDKPKETDYISCVAFGKTGENIANFVSKGQRLFVEGSLRISSYEDKQGNKRTSSDVNVTSFEFIEKREGGGNKASGFGAMGTIEDLSDVAF